MSEPAWRIVVTGPAERAIASIPPKYAAAVLELIEVLPRSPRRIGKPLRFELEGRWVARRGPYRVIYRFDEKRWTIEVLAVAHRSSAYRRP